MTATGFYLDTNAIIAIMEGPRSDDTGIRSFWRNGLKSRYPKFHTSELSFAELLTVPYRDQNRSLAEDYVTLFQDAEALMVHPVSRTVLDIAAVVRSRRKMKLPDAIHLATASYSRCSHFLTFDAGIAGLDNLQHPLHVDISLSPVSIVHPDFTSLAELTRTLS